LLPTKDNLINQIVKRNFAFIKRFIFCCKN